jgi:hypothetical protein
MRVVAILLGLISAFFVFYTVRLLVVTHGLQQTRAGGQGAYVGAVAFPVIALLFGWGCSLAWKRGSRATSASSPAR